MSIGVETAVLGAETPEDAACEIESEIRRKAALEQTIGGPSIKTGDQIGDPCARAQNHRQGDARVTHGVRDYTRERKLMHVLPAAERRLAFWVQVRKQGALDSGRRGRRSNSGQIIAVCDQAVTVERHPLTGIGCRFSASHRSSSIL